MTADYDPLALPAAYFEGLPTGVPNGLAPPEPVEVPAGCGACGVMVPEATARVVRRLLGSLDPARHDRLAQLHGGTAPELLCASCFNATLSVVNRSPAGGTRQ